jgi:YHS domain-containing protein
LDGDKHKSIVQQLGVRSYPTTVVLSPDGKVLSHITGFRTAAQLSVDLNKICPYESGLSNSQLAPIVRRSAQPRPQQSIFGGNCPVSPVETGKFSPANPQITSTFRGYSVSFASEAFRNAFAQNPAKYWPVADGMCVVSAAHGNGNKNGVLNNGVFYQGRIWLFADQSSRSAFEADPGKYLQWLQQQTQNVATAQRANAR